MDDQQKASPEIRGAAPRETPLVSVVIPTRNRRELLRILLASLDRQSRLPGPFEAIVADDGSSDGTVEFLESVAGSFRFALRFLRLSGRGPATARNRAIAFAAADRVLLLGDDTFPAADLLASHWEAGRQNAVGVQGRIEWDPEAPVTRVMRFLAPEGPQFYFKGLVSGEPIPYTVVYASNFSAPTRWFREEPFDEQFPAAAFEDTEMAFRWQRRGHTVVYWQGAVCRHRHHYDSIDGYLEKQKSAGRGARRAVRLHPAIAGRTILQPLAAGLVHATRYVGRRLRGTARQEDLWDLLCRAAFLRGVFSRTAGGTGPIARP